MVIIRACHHLSPWYQQMCIRVGSGERRFPEKEKMVSELLLLMATAITNSWLLIRFCLFASLPCFIRFISFGHWGWPGSVTSFHELRNESALLRWGLWFIQLCWESTVLLRHHQGERHVWVLMQSLFLLVSITPNWLDCWCYYSRQALFSCGVFWSLSNLFCNIWVMVLTFVSQLQQAQKVFVFSDQVSNILNVRTSCWSGSWVKERLAKSTWQNAQTSARTATRCWSPSRWASLSAVSEFSASMWLHSLIMKPSQPSARELNTVFVDFCWSAGKNSVRLYWGKMRTSYL